MVNYRYDETCIGYQQEKAWLFAQTLAEELPMKLGTDENGALLPEIFGGVSPYIQYYPDGKCVSVRRLTHIAEEDLETLRKRIDDIYMRVMACDDESTGSGGFR